RAAAACATTSPCSHCASSTRSADIDSWRVGAPDQERLERIGRIEARFREINERIESGHDPADRATLVGFICECGMQDCERLVELTPAEYEHVRSNPRWFALLAGHEAP